MQLHFVTTSMDVACGMPSGVQNKTQLSIKQMPKIPMMYNPEAIPKLRGDRKLLSTVLELNTKYPEATHPHVIITT